MKPFEYDGVEAEKAEAMRRYNNRRSFRNILRLAAVALLCYFWFPTVAVSFQTVYRTGSVILTDRSVVFVFVNLIVSLIFLLSRESSNNEKSSSTEQDLYDHYISSFSAVIVTTSDEKVVDDDSNKQIVPAFEEAVTTKKEIYRPLVESAKVVEYDEPNKGIVKVVDEPTQEAVTTKKEICRPVMESAKVVEYDESNKQIVKVVDELTQEAVTGKGIYRRTKSEAKKKKYRPVIEYRRTESAKVVAMERLSSEEFRLKVESFIMEKKKSLVLENDVVQCQGQGLGSSTASGSGYGSW